MAPSITETLYALGLGDRVVGVTRDCHYPPEVEKRQEDRQRRRLLRSELRGHPGAEAGPGDYAGGASPGAAEVREAEAGNAGRLPPDDRRDHRVVPHDRPRLRQGAGRPADGPRFPGSARSHPPSRREMLPRPRVLFVLDRTFGCGHLADLYVAGDDDYFDTIIELAGGQNAYRQRGVRYPVVSTEGILWLNPDVIVDLVPPDMVRATRPAGDPRRLERRASGGGREEPSGADLRSGLRLRSRAAVPAIGGGSGPAASSRGGLERADVGDDELTD